jgi:Arc/MetJ family transcription regulator
MSKKAKTKINMQEIASRHKKLLHQRKANVDQMLTAFINGDEDGYEALKKANDDLNGQIAEIEAKWKAGRG